MVGTNDVSWFKKNFHHSINKAVQGTPFDIDMITAIACQETGSLWGTMRRDATLTPAQIVAFCCGDMIDGKPNGKGRKAFPRTKADLIAKPRGQEMYDIARNALEEMARRVPGYELTFRPAGKNKFSRGYGVFQRDLQFFVDDPDYFLDRRYEDFDASLDHCLGELHRGLTKVGLKNATSITDAEFATVAIAYNTGGYKKSKGLRQGHFDGSKFYGEYIADYVALARTVATPGSAAVITPPAPGEAIVALPTPASATGPRFRVDTQISTLRLRSEPKISTPSTKNIVAEMPDGHVVRSFTGVPTKGFIEVEAELGGSVFRGFASAQFLKKITAPQAAAAATAAAPVSGIPEAHMPTKAGTVIKRTANAGAHSLNEPNMPRRTATDADGLRRDIAAIIAYLQPEKSTHKRYLPRDGLTFCNIYAHDFCMLSGVYLPRCWWTGPALVKLAAGEKVEPKYEATITEMRANNLFRWLRDFGPGFGWRQALSINDLQTHANAGGVALIVARRKEEGRSGHIVPVVPETATEAAKRDANGIVTAPLQSQAGAVNFSYGTGSANWWKGAQFAESAFWTHA